MRKVLTVIGIILGSLLILLSSSVLILRSSRVQTYIAGHVAKKLSEQLDADVSIQHIHYRPLNHLTIDSLYISDQQRDTLAFIEQAHIAINLLQLTNDRLDLTQVALTRPYINLQSLNDSTLNCQFLLNQIQRSDSAVFPLRVNVDQLQLSDVRFRYNDLLVDELHLNLELPVLSSDSLDVNIHNLTLRAQLDRLDAGFNATLHGNLDSIFADQMLLVYRNNQIFDGNIAVYHPTRLDSLHVEANCKDLYLNYALLQDFLSQLHAKPIRLPKTIASLGHMHYRGVIDGRLEHLNLHGAFTSKLGTVTTNGYLQSDTTLQNIDFCGHLSTNHFQLGKLLNNNDLGMVSLHAHVDGNIDSMALTHCIAEANIEQIEYRGYTYHDILFDGIMGVEELSGKLHINDENISLNINGLVDWSDEDTRLDITTHIAELRPNAIHLTDQYPDLSISATSNISLSTSGTTKQMLDNLNGYLIIDTLDIRNGEKRAVMEKLELHFDSDKGKGTPTHHMRLQSDYLTANISGQFQYITLPNTIRQLLHQHIPSIVQKPETKNKQSNTLDFYAYFRKLEDISKVLELPVSLPSYPTIKGSIKEENQHISVQAHIPYVHTSGTQIDNLTLSAENSADKLNVAVYMYNHLPKNNPTAAKIGDVKLNMNFQAISDSLDMKIQLNNTDSVRNEGIIHISSLIKKHAKKPLFDIHLHPTNIILNDSAWSISDATITYAVADTTIDIQHFELNTDYQTIAASGTASPHPEDSITVDLRNIDLQYLLSYTLAGEAISVQGPLTGWATLYGLFTQPMVEAEVAMPKAGLNGTYLGDLTANAYLNREEKSIIINGHVIDSTQHKVASVEGKVLPQTKWWGLDIHCDSVDIGLIDFWTHTFFTNPQGRAYGNLRVSGQKRHI